MDTLTNSAAAAGYGSCDSTYAAANATHTGTDAVGAIYCGLSNPSLFTATTFNSGSIEAQSLAKAKLGMAVKNNPNVENKTFGTSTGMVMSLNNPNAGTYNTQAFAVINKGPFADFTDMDNNSYDGVAAHLAAALGRDRMVYKTDCYTWIAMGLGDNNELVQSTTTSSPVYFPQDQTYGPNDRYAHMLAVIQVDKSNSGSCSSTTETAKFLGVVANVPVDESDHLVGVNNLVQQGWENRQ